MKKLFILLGIGVLTGGSIYAQTADSTQQKPNMASQKREDPKNGHLSGKIVDNTTKAGIGAASIQVFTITKDSVTGEAKEKLFTITSSSGKGDFEIADLPVYQRLKVVVNAANYGSSEQNVSFFQKPQAGGKPQTGGQGKPGGGMRGGGMVTSDKNLGDIALAPAASDLGNVTVTSAGKQFFQMGVDRKIFNVDKDIASSGQSAQEVLAHIPTLNVDIDGNVTMRNATPQVYVDGFPSTLTLEQIPSDLIEKVELITNPSAKYDASGGGGGIINIVLKKNKKTGYNGGLRAGFDTQGRANLGGDFSYRQGKFNFSANAGYMNRQNKSTLELNRYNKSNNTTLTQNSNDQKRSFRMLMGNLSLDYLMDNKNTFTVGGGIFDGKMNNHQPMSIDSINGRLGENDPFSYSNLNSTSEMHFTNYNGRFSYKHLFGEKDNHDLTANFQYNSANNSGNTFTTANTYDNPDFTGSTLYPGITSNTNIDGYRKQWVAQADYENPITDNSKIEAGVRAQRTNFYSNSLLSTDSTGNPSALQPRYAYSSKYEYIEHVYAAYATFTSKIGPDFTYQVGARIESSKYDGSNMQQREGGLPDSISNFSNKFPLNLFPSLFLTYNLPNRQDVQFNYTRKINRPNFFQLLPTIDISNPYNLSQGNPGLKPEFTSNYELSYNKTYEHSGNFLATAYMRYTSGLITSYQYNYNNSADTLMNTYINADHSYTYGLELTNSIQATKMWNVMLNVNLFNTKIDASNTAIAATNQKWSWNAKMNNDFKLPGGFTFQLNGSYWGKTVLPNAGGSSTSSGGGGRGGGGFNFSPLGSAQGYLGARFNLDAALKKDWKAKNGNTLSLILAMNDVLRTNYNKSYSETSFIEQYQKRLNNPQVLRVTLSWRFGKLDTNLFKRKNNKDVDGGGDGDMMGG